MPHPPKILRRLGVLEDLNDGGRQQASSHHIEKAIKIDNVPLKQRVLEAMQTANEHVNMELDVDHKLLEVYGHLKTRGLLEDFIEAFKTALQLHKFAHEPEIKNIFFGIQKRLHIKLNTDKGLVRFLVVDNDNNLVVSMIAAVNDDKQAIKDVERSIKQNYSKLNRLQPNNMKLVGLNLSLTFSVKDGDKLPGDLFIMLRPFM